MYRGEGNFAFDLAVDGRPWSDPHMKNALFVAAALAVCAVTANAATVEDADGNGTYSMEEIAAAYPGVTEDAFAEMDTDQSGDISEDELAAAVDAGALAE